MFVLTGDEDPILETRRIEIGRKQDAEIEVLSGLSSGDRIVSQIVLGLRAGERVEAAPDTSDFSGESVLPPENEVLPAGEEKATSGDFEIIDENVPSQENESEIVPTEGKNQFLPKSSLFISSRSCLLLVILFSKNRRILYPSSQSCSFGRDCALCVGVLATVSISKESAPYIEYGVVTISTVYSGASAIDVDELVTREIEDRIKNISGLDKFSSVSRDGVSMITLEFEPGRT